VIDSSVAFSLLSASELDSEINPVVTVDRLLKKTCIDSIG